MSMTGLPLVAESLYRPAFSVLGIVMVLALCVLTVVLAARRERSTTTALLRIGALLGLGWVLLGYSQTEPGIPSNPDRPRLAILLDTSLSMAQADAGSDASRPAVSRLDAVRNAWLSDDRLAKLRRVANVELIGFDQQARPADPEAATASGEATRLIEALRQPQADATLLLSDGHDTTGLPQSAGNTSSSAGRLFAVPVGTARSAPDLAVQAWPTSDRLFEGQGTTVTVNLSQRKLEGNTAIVELIHNGQRVDQRVVRLNRSSQQTRFEIKPGLQPGRAAEAHHYTARARLVDQEEAYTENNAEDLFVQVSRGRIRVLLVEGEPYWDTRSLARLIAGHPRFDLTAAYAFGPQRRSRIYGQDLTPGTDPTSDLTPFDIVILGRRVDRLVDAGFAQRLVTHARSGGAVVYARGQAFDLDKPLGRSLADATDPISPVQWAEPIVGDMRVRISSTGGRAESPLAGLRDNELVSTLPGMLAATQIDGRKAASLIILEQAAGDGPPMAAMTSLRVGEGTVLAVLTEGLWRWELLPSGVTDQAETVYSALWLRALQWLASGGAFLPGQDIAIEADRLGVEPGETVGITVSTRYIEDALQGFKLTAVDAQGDAQPITLKPSPTTGKLSASFSPQRPGIYTLKLTTPGRDELIDPASPLTTRVAVVERSAEKRDTSAKPELLKQLAEATGGRCLTLDEPQPLIDYLQSLQSLRGAQPRVIYDFNQWPVFAWIAGCFGLEWILRRSNGLR